MNHRKYGVIPGFEEYISDSANSKIINHRSVNGKIQYLFADNSTPPNTEWVQVPDSFPNEMKTMISQYWEMMENIDDNGLPIIQAENIAILDHTSLVNQSKSDKLFFVEVQGLGNELLTSSQILNSVNGGLPVFVEYCERQMASGFQ